MSTLGPSEKGLLEALRERDEPTEQDRERVRAAVLSRIAVAAAVGIATVATSSQVNASSGSSLPLQSAHPTGAALGEHAAGPLGQSGLGQSGWWGASATAKLLLASVAVVGMGAAVVLWPAAPVSSADQVAPSRSVPKTPPVLPMVPASAPVAASPEEPTPVAPSALPLELPTPTPPARAATGSDVSVSSLDAELALISSAQQALQGGAPAKALEVLDQHAREFPRGVLSVERSGLRAVALCAANRLPEGQSAGQAFLSRNPRSPLAARIRGVCRLGEGSE